MSILRRARWGLTVASEIGNFVKVSCICCVEQMNEFFQPSPQPAPKYSTELVGICADSRHQSQMIVVEDGIARSANVQRDLDMLYTDIRLKMLLLMLFHRYRPSHIDLI